MKKTVCTTLALALVVLCAPLCSAPPKALSAMSSVPTSSPASFTAALARMATQMDLYTAASVPPWIKTSLGCNLGFCVDCTDGGICCLTGHPRVNCICVGPPATSCPP